MLLNTLEDKGIISFFLIYYILLAMYVFLMCYWLFHSTFVVVYFSFKNTNFILTHVYLHEYMAFNTCHINFQMFGNKKFFSKYRSRKQICHIAVGLSVFTYTTKCHWVIAHLWAKIYQ